MPRRQFSLRVEEPSPLRDLHEPENAPVRVGEPCAAVRPDLRDRIRSLERTLAVLLEADALRLEVTHRPYDVVDFEVRQRVLGLRRRPLKDRQLASAARVVARAERVLVKEREPERPAVELLAPFEFCHPIVATTIFD